jgi:hypothetical protein
MSKLPTVTSNIPRDLRTFTDRVREALDSQETALSAAEQRLLRSIGQVSDALDNLPDGSTGNYVTPPAPTGLQALGALANIIVSWDAPNYLGHAYTEIWAAQEPEGGGVPVLGDAVMIGMSPGAVFAHNLGEEATRWYWARFVNIADEKGPYNAVEGTQGSTSPDPTILLDLLEGQITESQLFIDLGARIDLIDGPEGMLGSVAQRLAAEAQARADAIAAEALARGTAISNEQTLRKAADDALASDITTLTAVVDSNTSAIVNEQTARATADASIASDLTALQNVVEDPLTGLSATADALTALDTRVTTAEGTITSTSSAVTSLQNTVNNPTTGVVANASAISALETSVSDAEGDITAITSRVSTLETSVNDPTTGLSAISVELDAVQLIANNNEGELSTQATAISGIQSSINDPTTGLAAAHAAVVTEASTRAAETGDLFAQYTVKVDVNGYVSGFGLASTEVDGVPSSSFIVRSDSFAIGTPGGTDPAPSTPFIVRTTPTTINGRTVPAGTYISDAFIGNGTINNAMIGVGVIDEAHIADATILDAYIQNLDANVITSGFLSADRIEAGSIAAGKIDTRGLSIKDLAGNIILAAGTALNWSNVGGTGKPADNADVTGDNVALAIANQGGFATLDQITPANVGTYIASAAIKNAYIESLDAVKITTGFLDVARLAAGSITAEKLTVKPRDLTNLIPDGLVTDNTLWDGLTFNTGGELPLTSKTAYDGVYIHPDVTASESFISGTTGAHTMADITAVKFSGILRLRDLVITSGAGNGLIFEAGANASGIWIGLRDSGNTLRIRVGDGSISMAGNTSYNGGLCIDLTTADFFKDGAAHDYAIAVDGASAGVSVYVDGTVVAQRYTSDGVFSNGNRFTGTDNYTYLTTSTNTATGEALTAASGVSTTSSARWYEGARMTLLAPVGDYFFGLRTGSKSSDTHISPYKVTSSEQLSVAFTAFSIGGASVKNTWTFTATADQSRFSVGDFDPNTLEVCVGGRILEPNEYTEIHETGNSAVSIGFGATANDRVIIKEYYATTVEVWALCKDAEGNYVGDGRFSTTFAGPSKRRLSGNLKLPSLSTVDNTYGVRVAFEGGVYDACIEDVELQPVAQTPLIVEGGIVADFIKERAIFGDLEFTTGTKRVTTGDNYLNPKTVFSQNIQIDGVNLFARGGFIVTFECYMDNTFTVDSFGMFTIEINDTEVLRQKAGIRSSGGNTVFSMPVTLTTIVKPNSAGTTNVKVKCFNSRWDNDNGTNNAFDIINPTLRIMGTKR